MLAGGGRRKLGWSGDNTVEQFIEIILIHVRHCFGCTNM